MLNADKTKLLIFEDFKVDFQLPKFKESKMKQEDFSSAIVIQSAAQWSKPSAWKRFTSWFARKPKPEPPPTMTIEEFFSHVKNTTAELVVVKEKAQGSSLACLVRM